ARIATIVSDSDVNHVSVPQPTPRQSSSVCAVPDTAEAVDAAAKIAAHDRIVDGFDAVAASDVRNARPGEATSSVLSPPSRTRNADHSVRSPSQAITAAPTSPSATCSGPISSSCPAPSAPKRAYEASTTAAPAPIATPEPSAP